MAPEADDSRVRRLRLLSECLRIRRIPYSRTPNTHVPYGAFSRYNPREVALPNGNAE